VISSVRLRDEKRVVTQPRASDSRRTLATRRAYTHADKSFFFFLAPRRKPIETLLYVGIRVAIIIA